MRALLRLVRPALGDFHTIENAHFRDAARSLSPLRDAHTALVAYDLLLDHYRGEVRRAPLAAVWRHLVQVEERTKHDTDDLEDRYAQVRAEMEAARRRIDDWPITDLGLETWRAGFERTYRRARRAMSTAYDDPTPEHFHEWRKAAKYHGYHGHGRVGMRLFAEKPRRIAARHSRYWSAWNEQQRCDASMDLRQSAA